jgi:hypothetical protein
MLEFEEKAIGFCKTQYGIINNFEFHFFIKFNYFFKKQ